jgi:hypothetical protein
MGTYIDVKTNRNIPTVNTYNDLPPAISNVAEYYWVLNSQGTAWLPGGLGGTYYPKGLYFSNGATWSHMETPVQASLTEVNAGVVDDKFVSPNTLQTSDLATKFRWTLDLTSVQTISLVAPRAMQIDSVTVLEGIFTETILVNSNPYTFGTPIAQADRIDITIDAPGSLNLNITKL